MEGFREGELRGEFFRVGTTFPSLPISVSLGEEGE